MRLLFRPVEAQPNDCCIASGCSVAATTTIHNSRDASALSTCTIFIGSIAVATDTSDNIDLGGIQRIAGSLVANGVPNLVSLSGKSLSVIDSAFTLSSLDILSDLIFPALTAVDTIDWLALPNLQGVSFLQGLERVSSISIQYTELGSLVGMSTSIDTLVVVNNFYLYNISLELYSIRTLCNIGGNGITAQVDFPNLSWAYNMTLSNCSRIALPSLTSINGYVGF